MALKLGQVSGQYIQLILDTAKSLECEPKTLTDKFGLKTHQGGYAVASINKFMKLGFEAIQQTRCQHFGLEMAKQQHIGHLGLVGLATMTAPTLLKAVQTYTHFEPLLSFNRRGQSSVTLENQGATLRFYSLQPYNQYNLFVVDFVLAGFVSLLNWLSNSQIKPLAVHIEYPKPAYHQSLRQFFDCPVHYSSDSNSLVFSKQDLSCASIYSNSTTHLESINLCHQQLQQRPLELDELDQFRQLLSPMIQGSCPTIDEYANSMGIPPWTLRRRLKKAGTTFSELLDETRKELAINSLKDGELSIGEVAWRLGYANTSGFQRAFSRWTGKAPGAYRTSSNNKD